MNKSGDIILYMDHYGKPRSVIELKTANTFHATCINFETDIDKIILHFHGFWNSKYIRTYSSVIVSLPKCQRLVAQCDKSGSNYQSFYAQYV